MAQSYISASVPSQQVRVAGTTLFHVAAFYLNDATLWYVLAELNGISDPWISEETLLSIPSPTGLISNGGILGQ